MIEERVKLLNVFILGLCFCLVFTGFITVGQTQALVYSSAENLTASNNQTVFQANGFILQGTAYVVFALACWISPSVVVITGPRLSMVVASLAYAFQISQYLYLNTISVYVASVLIGIGAPILWTAQGVILTNNSNEDTIKRNSGIFYAMFMSSAVFGNLISYFLFQDQEIIDEETWVKLGAILVSVSGCGILVMLLLRPTPWVENKDDISFVGGMKDCWSLFCSPNMLALSLTLAFTGFNLSLWSGIYSGCIGFTRGFGPYRKSLASLSAILVAVGEVVGGMTLTFLPMIFARQRRNPVVILGCFVSLCTYAFMFINFPNDANNSNETDNIGYISPNKALALTSSFLLGFSDACFNTQVTSILGDFFKDQAASAFAIYKFAQSLTSAIYFFYSPYLGFHYQLLVLAVFSVAGTFGFVKVENEARRSADVDAPSRESKNVQEDLIQH